MNKHCETLERNRYFVVGSGSAPWRSHIDTIIYDVKTKQMHLNSHTGKIITRDDIENARKRSEFYKSEFDKLSETEQLISESQTARNYNYAYTYYIYPKKEFKRYTTTENRFGEPL